MLRGVCHSLRDAHAAGVIHRDIKPANLFVCHKGGELDFIKVLDLGLVKRFAQDGSAPPTIGAQVAGTPGYMPPEAIRGEAQDPRSDIYAIGCVAYRMLAGRDVFETGYCLRLSKIAATIVPVLERDPPTTGARIPLNDLVISHLP